jgi:hypothetical protein
MYGQRRTIGVHEIDCVYYRISQNKLPVAIFKPCEYSSQNQPNKTKTT